MIDKIVATAGAICIALLALAAAAVFAAPAEVGTTSVMLLPPRGSLSAQAYATNTYYPQGSLVTANYARYWAVVGGTNDVTTPSGTGDTVDGDVTWRHVKSGTRTGFLIVNPGPGTWHVSTENPATTNHPGLIENGHWLLEDYQGAVYVIATTNSRPFTPVEW